MRNFLLASAWLATPALLAQGQAPLPTPLTSPAAFEQWEQQQGGRWVVKWHPATGTPGTVYGTGLKIQDWGRSSLEEGRRCANRLLVEHADMLGTGTSSFQEVIGARMGRTWSFTFDQSFRGVPVLEGRVDVRINMNGVVAMLGSRAWPVPANFDVKPKINAQVAQAAAWAALGDGQLGAAPAPRLVIWGDIASQQLAPFHLCWEVPVHQVTNDDSGRTGRYFIDARTGGVRHFQSDKHSCGFANCGAAPAAAPKVDGPSVTLIEAPSVVENPAAPVPTTVTVMAWTRTGADAFSPLQNIPLPGVEVSVPGVGLRSTDANGEFVIDISAPVTISINGLDNIHHTLISGSSAPTGSVTVQPGVNASIQLLSASASSAQAAHTTACYWTYRSNEWARAILGNTNQMNIASGVNITVNNSNTCNATYASASNRTTYYSAGGGCQNTAFSTVVAHEWGHGLDNRYGGIANSNAEGLSEGWGDIIGMYQVDSPILGSGFQSPGAGIRNGTNARMWPYSSGSPHGAGEVWMGWAWRLREALRASLGTTAAVQISDDIVLSSIVADATTREDAVLQVFIADDDDGNLLNGTPHYSELESASVQKGIPYPEVPAFATFGVACESSTPLPPANCPQFNANGGTLAGTLRDNDYCYTVNNTQSYEIVSFEIYSGTTTGGNVTCPAAIYLDNNGTPEANPVATTSIVVGSQPGFYTATFAQPVPVSGRYYLGFNTSSNNVYLNTLTSGASGTAFWRDPPNGTPNWTQSGLIQRPSWRVNCQNIGSFVTPAMGVVGTPQLGATYQPQLSSAPTSSIATLVSGLSDQTTSQGAPLPIALPGAPTCLLQVSADVLAATVTNVAGVAQQPVTVPNQPTLLGLQVYHQWFVFDQAANALGLIASDAGRALIRN